MKKIIVFGSFVVDLMARTPHLPAPAETVKGSGFRMGPGGKGFNQGVAAHKAGADVLMITKVGRDAFASVAESTMDELGMRKQGLLHSEDTETGCALIMVDEKSSQNEIVVVPGACNTITREELEKLESLFVDADYVLMQLEVNQKANEIVAEMAKRHGCSLILNPAPYAPFSDEFLSLMSIVTPNEVEARQVSGVEVTDLESAKKAAAYFKARGVESVVITLGGKGVFVSCEGHEEIVPPYSVQAVDTTGAGDAFNGGFVTALAEGKSVYEAVLFANAVGALSVMKIGTTPAMPGRDEIDAFIRLHA